MTAPTTPSVKPFRPRICRDPQALAEAARILKAGLRRLDSVAEPQIPHPRPVPR